MNVDRTELTTTEVAALFETCSNLGRWGEDDQKGTLNYLDNESRRRAAALVTDGTVVPLGRPLSAADGTAEHRMLYVGHDQPHTCFDTVAIQPHGMRITHLDAIGHVYFNGQVYNGRNAASVVLADGLHHAAIDALAEGIFTRGVLLDIAAVRGVRWLEPGDKVFRQDLEDAEELAGVRVGRGDAIFLHTGIERREVEQGLEDPTRRPGLAAQAIPWLHEREIAVYSGDCIEALPSNIPDFPVPLHSIGMAAMGLVMLDNPTMTQLLDVCARLRRTQFLLVCAPLRIALATGSAVNPLAMF